MTNQPAPPDEAREPTTDAAWGALRRDIDLNWPDETPNEHYDNVLSLIDLARPLIEAAVLQDARERVEALPDASVGGRSEMGVVSLPGYVNRAAVLAALMETGS